jgi:hypothetical protein
MPFKICEKAVIVSSIKCQVVCLYKRISSECHFCGLQGIGKVVSSSQLGLKQKREQTINEKLKSDKDRDEQYRFSCLNINDE